MICIHFQTKWHLFSFKTRGNKWIWHRYSFPGGPMHQFATIYFVGNFMCNEMFWLKGQSKHVLRYVIFYISNGNYISSKYQNMHFLLDFFKGMTCKYWHQSKTNIMYYFLNKCSNSRLNSAKDWRPYLLLYTTKKCTLWQETNYVLTGR